MPNPFKTSAGGNKVNEFLQQLLNGAIIGSSYALLAVGLTLIFGIMRIVNFAHGEFYMIGGVICFYLIHALHLNYFVALVLAVLLAMAIGALLERSILRWLKDQSIDSTIIVTIGLSVFIQNVVLLAIGPVPKSIPSPFSNVPVTLGALTFTPVQLFVMIVTGLVIIGFHILLRHTYVGRAMRATFSEKDAARLVGIDTDRIAQLTFVLGSGMAALAGALLGSMYLVYPSMGGMAVLKAFIVVIMGGLGNIMGAITGGLLLGMAEGLVSGFISSDYSEAIGFIIVIVVLLFKPQGLFGRKGQV
jgi:branched-chain amino acid transport system permease protein